MCDLVYSFSVSVLSDLNALHILYYICVYMLNTENTSGIADYGLNF